MENERKGKRSKEVSFKESYDSIDQKKKKLSKTSRD